MKCFERFWSKKREDLCLSFNDGAYKGEEAIKAYYEAEYRRNDLVAHLLQKRFPEKLGSLSDEELYGIGPFKVKPMSCPIIEIAEDHQTAKGLWYCQGAYNKVEGCGLSQDGHGVTLRLISPMRMMNGRFLI